MLTADGPVLLECNARFGDPETQALLPRLAVAIGPLLLAAARGQLAGAAAALELDDARLPAVPGATVAVVLAAAGYPGTPRKGDPIEGLDRAPRPRRAGVPCRELRRRRRHGPNGGWPRARRRRTRAGPGDGPRRRRATRPMASRSTGSSAATTSRSRPWPAARAERGGPMIRRYTLARDGRHLVRDGALRGHAPRRARGGPRAGRSRPGPGRGARRARGRAHGRRRAHRRDRADDRPRRHRLRQPGRRDGRARRDATCTSA